jgi:hypothetical protein
MNRFRETIASFKSNETMDISKNYFENTYPKATGNHKL